MGWKFDDMAVHMGPGIMTSTVQGVYYMQRMPKVAYVLALEAVESLYQDEIELGNARLDLAEMPRNTPRLPKVRKLIHDLEQKIAGKDFHRAADLAQVGVVGPAPAAPPAPLSEAEARAVLRAGNPQWVGLETYSWLRDRRPASVGGEPAPINGAIPK